MNGIFVEDRYGAPVESRIVYEVIQQNKGLLIEAEAIKTGYGIATAIPVSIVLAILLI